MGVVVCMSNIDEYHAALSYDLRLDKKNEQNRGHIQRYLVEFYDAWREESLEPML